MTGFGQPASAAPEPGLVAAGQPADPAVASTARTPRPVLFAAAGLLGAALVIAEGNVHVGPGENGGMVPAVVTSALCLTLAGGLFGWVVPRRRPSGATALTMGILSVLTLVVFWSGVPLVIASAALASGSQTSIRNATTTTGRLLAAAATLVTLAATIAGSAML